MRYLITLAILAALPTQAQITTGQIIVPIKTAGGRTEVGVTLANGQVLGKSGGVPAAMDAQMKTTALTALVDNLTNDGTQLIIGDAGGSHLRFIPASGGFQATGTVFAGNLVGDGSLITNLDGDELSAGSVAMSKIAQGGATTGQAIVWNGSTFAPTTISSGVTIGSTTITGGTSGRLLTSGTTVGELTLGTGVSAALGNAVNAASGLLTYAIIGTSGAAVPLLNGSNTFANSTVFTSGIQIGSSINQTITFPTTNTMRFTVGGAAVVDLTFGAWTYNVWNTAGLTISPVTQAGNSNRGGTPVMLYSGLGAGNGAPTYVELGSSEAVASGATGHTRRKPAVFGPGRNVGLNADSTTTSFAGGDGVIFIGNCTTEPTTTPTGGGVFFVSGGALKFKGSSGTVTTIAVP